MTSKSAKANQQRRAHDYGDAPVEETYKEKMITIIKAINEMFNGDAPVGQRQTAVVLMVFPFGDDFDGRCNYMSNGVSREDMVTLLKEQAARFEGQFSAQEGKG